MHSRALLVSCLALITLLAGCLPRSEIRSAQRIGDIGPPEFRLVEGQTSVERFDPPGAGGVVALTIGASVFNPNPFPVKVTRIEYTVSLEDRQVTRATLEPDMLLAAEGTAPLRFNIETVLRNRPELLRAVVRTFAGQPMEFRVEGRLTFNSLAYEFRTGNRLLLEGATLARETVEAPVLRLAQRESEAYLLSPQVPVVRLVMNITNPGDIGYFLYGKDLALSLAGHAVATEDLRPVPVPAGSSTRIDIIFYPQRGTLTEPALEALQAALSGIPTAVEVDGRLAMDVLGVDAFAVPDDWKVVGFIYSSDR